MKNAEAEREKELKEAQKKLDCAKAKADASSKKTKEKQQVRTSLQMVAIFLNQHRAGEEMSLTVLTRQQWF